MLQVIYLPKSKKEIKGYRVINDLDTLINCLKFNKVDFLSIPASSESLDILDVIIKNNINIKTIHIQESNDLLGRIRLFFIIAKTYQENGIKRDIVLKYPNIDGFFVKKYYTKTNKK